MDGYVTGYQFNPDTKKYIGAYSFPRNLDGAALHLPPWTTLVSPPDTICEPGTCYFWGGDDWHIGVDFDYVPPAEVFHNPGGPSDGGTFTPGAEDFSEAGNG